MMGAWTTWPTRRGRFGVAGIALVALLASTILLVGLHLSSRSLSDILPVPGLSHPPPPAHDFDDHVAGGPPGAEPSEELNSTHRIWGPPELDPIVHGVHVSDALKAEPLYPLDPFPYTPMVAPPEGESEHNPWLAAVICAPWDGARRMMIRSTWMKLYADLPFDGRFVVSNPGPQWTDMIQLENRTFGDMIVLDHLQEDDFTANTIKTLEFYRWLLEKSPRKYEFVSKMDTDLWLNARGFWDRFLLPRFSDMSGIFHSSVNRTIFGQLYYSPPHRVVFPHGSMYTVTWDMVELLVSLQDTHHVIAGEDLAVAVLMLKGMEKCTVVNFKGSEKFDFDDRDTRKGEDTAWAPSNTMPTAAEHALYGDDVIAVHQLKDDRLWLNVASCFDEEGIKKMPPEIIKSEPPSDHQEGEDEEFNKEEEDLKKMVYHKSRFDAIPEMYWEQEDDGTWLCNGVWKTEHGVNRNPDAA